MKTNDRPRLSLCVGAAVAAAFSGAAMAEANPYYIGLSETVTHESNLALDSDAKPRIADTISATTLRAGFDQPIGRQRVFANLSASENRYRNNTIYNNTGHSLAGGLDWSTVERLSGSLTASDTESLAPFDVSTIGVRNLQHSRQAAADMQLGSVTALTWVGSLARGELSYSNPSARLLTLEANQTAASVGLRYTHNGAWVFGAALRNTNGEYPHAGTTAGGDNIVNTFRRRDLDWTANWAATGFSVFDARVSLTRQDYSLANVPSNSSVTGNVGWQWQATGKLRLTARVSRDTGAQNAFDNVTNLQVHLDPTTSVFYTGEVTTTHCWII